MTIRRRVETLEAVLLQTRDDADYKLVMLEEGESREEGIKRSGLKDWPADRTMILKFVSASDKLFNKYTNSSAPQDRKPARNGE